MVGDFESEPMVDSNKCSIEPNQWLAERMFVRADKPNRCSEQMFASARWIVAANRTNVRLRQDAGSGPEICKPNKCSPADTAADIVPHARPEDKTGTGTRTRAEPAADPEPDAEHAEPDARGKHAERHRNRMHAAAPSTPKRSGNSITQNAETPHKLI